MSIVAALNLMFQENTKKEFALGKLREIFVGAKAILYENQSHLAYKNTP